MSSSLLEKEKKSVNLVAIFLKSLF
jgi:hypothetical protein